MSEIKVIVPESWEDVSIKQYVDLAKIPKGLPPLDYVLEILHIFRGVPKELLYQTDEESLNRMAEPLTFLQNNPSVETVATEFNIKGTKYYYNRQFDKLSVGEMISLEMLVEKDKLTDTSSIPYLLAIILREKGQDEELQVFNADNIYDRITLFEQHISIGEAMGLVFFFKNGGRDYITILEDSLKELRIIAKEMKL